MRFKLDENLPLEAALPLTDLGHDAMTVYGQRLSGEKDDRLLDICAAEDRIIITLDLDFADIRTYPPENYCGIIVLRPSKQDKRHVLSLIVRFAQLFETEEVKNRLWIVDNDKVRIRGETSDE